MPSAADKKQVAKPGENKGNANKNYLARFYSRFFEGKAAAWTAGATVAMVIFSSLLWRVSREANQTNIATQRASMSSLGPAVTKVPSADGKTTKGYNFYFTWANSGTTPTKDAVMQSSISLGNYTLDAGTDFSKLPQGETRNFALGPKAAIQMEPTYVSLEDLEAVDQRKKHLFFWGWTRYHDIFPGTPMRLTEFCFEVVSVTWSKPDHADFSADMSMLNPTCKVHFCFDDACEDYEQHNK